MDNEDLPKNSEPTDESEDAVERSESFSNGEIAAWEYTPLRAQDGTRWAQIWIRQKWSPDGRTFWIETSQYQAASNGGTGRLFLQLESGAQTSIWHEIVHEARQDGQVHRVVTSKSISANALQGVVRLSFRWNGNTPDLKNQGAYGFVAVRAPTVNPIKNTNSTNVILSGNGAMHNVGTVFVETNVSTSDYQAISKIDGSWEVPVSFSQGGRHMRFNAYQMIEDRIAGDVLMELYRAYITTPASVSIVTHDTVFKGYGAPGSRVTMYNGANVLTDPATVGTSDEWQSSFKNQPASGRLSIVAEYALSGFPTVRSAAVDYFMLGLPRITGPTVETQPSTFTLTGDSGLEGAAIAVMINGTTTIVGNGSVFSTGYWTATVALDPGFRTLTVNQTKSGKTSLRAASRGFKIKPNPPTLMSRPKGDSVEFYGLGLSGAEVAVHRTGVGTALFNVTVPASGNWAKDAPDNLLPGNNLKFDAKQSVSDGGSGRIASDWSVRLEGVNIPVSSPTGIAVSRTGQRLTFKGQGRRWEGMTSYVRLYDDADEIRDIVPDATVGSTLSWETTATSDFAPGVYAKLVAKQLVKINNTWVFSARAVVPQTTVPSPTPTFSEPPTTTDQRPRIVGTAWRGSSVIVKISGKPDVPLTATAAGTFTLDASEDWAPGSYTISATATFGGQPATSVNRAFTVKTPVPLIETPSNAEVDLDPVIEGQGWPGCWIEIYSMNNPTVAVGRGEVGSDRKFAVTLIRQNPGTLSLYAKQKEGQSSTNISDNTAPFSVRVRLAAPTITDPPINASVPRTSTISGRATGDTVDLYIKDVTDPLVANIPVIDGGWSRAVSLPAGNKTLEAVVKYDGLPSSRGAEHPVKVVPDVPQIDTPLPDEAVGNPLLISGFGFPGDTIRIDGQGNVNLGSAPVNAAGTWTARLDPKGQSTLKVLASAGAGLDSSTVQLQVAPLLDTLPRFTEPLPGDWVGIRPRYSGLATPGASISVASWFDTAVSLAPSTVADEYGRWEVMGNRDVPEGQAWVVVRQTGDGIDSQWVESGRFMVEKMQAEFDPPFVDFPRMGQDVGRYPMFSGHGEPGAKILIVKEGDGNTYLVDDCWVDRNGKWAARSKIELPLGDYRYSTRQTRDGATSAWLSPSRTVKVIQVEDGFAAAVIDSPANNATGIAPRPHFYGAGMPGAALSVCDSEDGSIYAQTLVDVLGSWSVRSEVDLSIGSHKITCQQTLDGQDSVRTADVNFKVANVIIRPVVTSPAATETVSPQAVIRGTALPGAVVRLVIAEGEITKGTAIVDAQGHWVMVTTPLPLGNLSMKARASKGSVNSDWRNFNLTVADLG